MPDRRKWKLKTTNKEREISLVPGPHPYLWIGDSATGECFGTIGGVAQDRTDLIALRDALTKALRRH